MSEKKKIAKLVLRKRDFGQRCSRIPQQREVRGRERLQVEPAFTGFYLEPVVLRIEGDVGPVRQRSQDVLELARGYREVLIGRAFAGLAACRDLYL